MKKYIVLFILFLMLLNFLQITSLSAAEESHIVIDKTFHLTLLKNTDNDILAVYPNATGSEKNIDEVTPNGNFYVIDKTLEPKWRWNGKIYAPYKIDSQNGLGVYWIGYNLTSYGLHGTNEPFNIGKNASHGCIRHQNTDILKISKLVKNGTKIDIIQSEIDNKASSMISDFLELYDLMNVLMAGGNNV